MVPDFIDSRAVWHGEELISRSDWLHTLNQRDLEELTAAAAKLTDAKFEAATDSSFVLPQVLRRLSQIQDTLETGTGATLIRGIPIKHISKEEITRMFWGLVQHLGTPVSQSPKGKMLFHVRDEGLRHDDVRSRGPNTRNRLSFHTDRCDVIAFMCLQQAKSGGENYLISSATLYNEVQRQRPDLAAELMRPYYYKRHNVDHGNKKPYCRQPIFSFCQGYFAASYLRVLIDRAYDLPELPNMTDRQREALDFLDNIAEDPSLHFCIRLQPGDVLLLNNWVTFHRRTGFTDYPEAARKRHILRVWLSVPNSRPIDPLFKANYGSTAAGVVRGGMCPESGSYGP